MGNLESGVQRTIQVIDNDPTTWSLEHVEALHRSLKQSEAPIVSKSSGVLHQIIETPEGHFVSSCRLDFQLGRLP